MKNDIDLPKRYQKATVHHLSLSPKPILYLLSVDEVVTIAIRIRLRHSRGG